MRRFVLKCLYAAIGCGVSVVVVLAGRIGWFVHSNPQRMLDVAPGTRILGMGSSAIGCALASGATNGISTLWRSQLPPQYTLMRLNALEREGKLQGVETVLFEVGYQSINQQLSETAERIWIETLPLSFRYLDLVPVGRAQAVWRIANNLRMSYNVREMERPNPGLGLVQRDREWQENDLADKVESYFVKPRDDFQMGDGWRESLRQSIEGIVIVCRRNGITPILLICPMSSSFRASVPDDARARLDMFIRFAQSLDIRVIDTRAWMADMYFMNVNHLSVEGARIFTNRLINEELR